MAPEGLAVVAAMPRQAPGVQCPLGSAMKMGTQSTMKDSDLPSLIRI